MGELSALGAERAGARLIVASGAPRLLAAHAAACWRCAAAAAGLARGAADDPAEAGLWCAAGFGSVLRPGGFWFRSLDHILLRCWYAAAPPGAVDLAQPCSENAWMAEGRVLETGRLGAPGDELALAAVYEAAAAKFAEVEARLCESFERDKAPAARLAAARAVAEHFGCGNLRCARTAGLRRADAKALFPPKRCSRCLVLRYCSAECQAADWRAGHNDVCRALAPSRLRLLCLQ